MATNIMDLAALVARAVESADELTTTREVTRLPGALLPTVAPDEASYDICGRLRSPATLRSFRLGQAPENKGKTYKPRHLTHEEMGRLLEACKDNPAGRRGRALIVLQWRSGLRIMEALNLQDHDLDREAGTVFVEHGKGNKSGIVGMDDWAWEQIQPWREYRYNRYPDGPVFCVVQGATKGGRWSEAAARTFYHATAARAGITKRVHPHMMRHTFAVDLDRGSLRHSDPGITGRYLVSISSLYLSERVAFNAEIIKKVRSRPAPELIA